MNTLMKKLILTALAFMTGALSVTYAINPVRIDTVRTQLVVPRPALEPLKSLVTSPTDAIDTLDTANEHIKVVLHADNTWHYYKTPSFQQVSGVYDCNWDDNSTNPYGIEQKDLPDEWAIWLVDSLDQYHCPFQGSVYHRGKFGVRRGRRHQGKAGFHAVRSEAVNAPIIEELPFVLECEMVSYDEDSNHLVGRIVNISADERILTDGKIDYRKLRPITYDPIAHHYIELGEVVGNAFSDGKQLK